MNPREYANKDKSGQLTEEEWEELAQTLLDAKFDYEHQKKLAASMAKRGIHRIPKPVTKFSIKRILTIAASALILLTAGWFVFSNTDSNVQELAQEYLEQPFKLNEGNIRGQNKIEENRGKAIEAYNNQDFEKAIKYLQLIESEGQAIATDFFQMGLCFIHQKQPDYRNALAAFNRVRSLDENKYVNEMNWLSGLCAVMLKENDLAKNYLKKVVDSRSSRQQEAAMTLLNELL